MKLTLPKPPALNALYGHNRFGGVYLKAAGKKWKEEVYWLVRQQKPSNWASPISLVVDLYTCRHQDNDGILKVLQDALQSAGVYQDDYWIFDLRVVKHRCKKSEEKIEVEVDIIPTK